MKTALEGGEVMRGVSIMIPSPQLVEMVGLLGFDWVLLDCEHGTMSPETVEVMTMAAEAAGITALARPRSRAPEAIQEVLARGVAGVQVPHVESARHARAVVEAVKYHPKGKRGLAAHTRPAGYGLRRGLVEHARRANEETIICVQVESREGLGNLDEILAVDEIDVVFLGPADLSQSLGHPGEPEHPDVVREMADAFKRIKDRGRVAGSAGSASRWKQYRSQDVTYLYTHVPTLLTAGSAEYLGPRMTVRDRQPALS